MIQAFHCPSKREILSPFTYEKAALGPYDIFVKISHCGLCHSDIHLIDDNWKITKFPLVPGHEIIGTVEEKGPAVDFLKIGDRIGIGWQGKSCMACEWCLQGDENLCAKEEDTCVGHFGGFAKEIVADGRFAFVIPEALPSAETAPLLCGGATVFAPLIEHKIAPTMKVAVLGIGGLGHLAIQFVRALGCEVTAISHSADKENDAKKFGAHHFIHVQGFFFLCRMEKFIRLHSFCHEYRFGLGSRCRNATTPRQSLSIRRVRNQSRTPHYQSLYRKKIDQL